MGIIFLHVRAVVRLGRRPVSRTRTAPASPATRTPLSTSPNTINAVKYPCARRAYGRLPCLHFVQQHAKSSTSPTERLNGPETLGSGRYELRISNGRQRATTGVTAQTELPAECTRATSGRQTRWRTSRPPSPAASEI